MSERCAKEREREGRREGGREVWEEWADRRGECGREDTEWRKLHIRKNLEFV